MRDVKRMLTKMKCVLFPRISTESRYKEIRDWDLWGPLFICLTLSVLLSIMTESDESATVFGIVFSVVAIGGAVVTLNA